MFITVWPDLFLVCALGSEIVDSDVRLGMMGMILVVVVIIILVVIVPVVPAGTIPWVTREAVLVLLQLALAVMVRLVI